MNIATMLRLTPIYPELQPAFHNLLDNVSCVILFTLPILWTKPLTASTFASF